MGNTILLLRLSFFSRLPKNLTCRPIPSPHPQSFCRRALRDSALVAPPPKFRVIKRAAAQSDPGDFRADPPSSKVAQEHSCKLVRGSIVWLSLVVSIPRLLWGHWTEEAQLKQGTAFTHPMETLFSLFLSSGKFRPPTNLLYSS